MGRTSQVDVSLFFFFLIVELCSVATNFPSFRQGPSPRCETASLQLLEGNRSGSFSEPPALRRTTVDKRQTRDLGSRRILKNKFEQGNPLNAAKTLVRQDQLSHDKAASTSSSSTTLGLHAIRGKGEHSPQVIKKVT